MSGNILHWMIASASAGIGGVFALLTYVHSNFVSQEHMDTHVRQPHINAVTVERYNEDIRYLRDQITEINRKLDRAIK